ncbi:MAG: hypothetical protein GXP56_13090 [Deltaproteobacteria bacterium]|nr:hypothetical protein [Deltaproteobacteria bacterium]
MSNDIERNHFKLKISHMKNLIVQTSTKPVLKIGEGSLGGDITINSCIGSVGSAPVMVPQNLKKFVHVLMSVNIPEHFKQKKRDRIIGRRTFNAVARSTQGPDKGKIN